MPSTDAHLVQRAAAGDRDAFERLVRRHLRAAFSVAMAVLGDAADAEDVCQDAFLRALQRIEQCRDPERFAPWLLQIVRNQARNHHRGEAVRRALPLEHAAQVAAAGGPERDAERARARERLLSALQHLTETQREVVLLHDLEGWRHREIAEALELPEGTVRYHLSVARRELRTRLAPTSEEPE